MSTLEQSAEAPSPRREVSTDHGESHWSAAAQAGADKTALARVLKVLFSPDARTAGRLVFIPAKLSIGRVDALDIDLVVADRMVSRRHATVQRCSDGSYEAVDHETTNGTFVDGRRINRQRLADGAILRVGDTLFEFGTAPVESLPPSGDPALVGESEPFLKMLAAVSQVAPSDVAVLLLGETGTGKELIARRIHALSGRSGAFVPVNCSAIPRDLAEAHLFGHVKGSFTGAAKDMPGYFATAAQGTLFLDEVGELPPGIQPKLLRALSEHEYTPVGSTETRTAGVRIVSATNRALGTEAGGDFRLDLYARLASFVIEPPPLRARRADIPLLLAHFFATAAPGKRFTWNVSFLEALLVHRWPWNIRELRATVQKLVITCDAEKPLDVHHLPAEITTSARQSADAARPEGRSHSPIDTPVEVPVEPSREALADLLRQSRGNVTELAARCGRDRKQIYRWLQKYGLDPAAFRGDDDA